MEQPYSFWDWPVNDGTSELETGSVHIWCADLRAVPPLSKLTVTLSADERARASRFAFFNDRHAYVAARAILRDILSRYIGCEAEEIKFNYGPTGKPALPSQLSGSPVYFNLSHSNDLALYAVTRLGEIGIDHEWIQDDLSFEHLAGQFLSPREFEALRLLPRPEQPEAFFKCWTRMEAYLKARGWGLAEGIDALRRHDPKANVAGEIDSGWSFRLLSPAPGFIGAATVENPAARWFFWRWQATRPDEMVATPPREPFARKWKAEPALPAVGSLVYK